MRNQNLENMFFINIIQDFMEDEIKNLFKLLGNKLKNTRNFSEFVLELKK